MFENQTEREIKNRLLSNISAAIDKSEGSFVYDVISPVALELALSYLELENVAAKMSIENLSSDELDKRVFERTGITRKPATKATGLLQVTGTGTINKGDIFQTKDGIQFQVLETKDILTMEEIEVEALFAGQRGNIPADQITIIAESIPGITGVNNLLPTTGGYNAESDKELLKRYFERVQTPATSGNIAHYRNWAKEVTGVGEAKIIPTWNGGGTVKVIIVDSEKRPAEEQVLLKVKEHIEAERPIGVDVTVTSALAKNINVTATVVLANGFSLSQVQAAYEKEIKDYLKRIAFKDNTVSYARIGSILLDTNGLADYSELQLNGHNVNIAIGEEEIPVLEAITIEVDLGQS